MAGLKRTLNFAEVTFFAAGVILGAGIYTIIGLAAGYGAYAMALLSDCFPHRLDEGIFPLLAVIEAGL